MKYYRAFIKTFNSFVVLLIIGVIWVRVFDKDSLTFYMTDTSVGEKLYESRKCFTCHGVGGKDPQVAEYPHLNGQPSTYLFTQMKDIKSGLRSNGMTSVMKIVVEQVRDDELREIARYLSQVD